MSLPIGIRLTSIDIIQDVIPTYVFISLYFPLFYQLNIIRGLERLDIAETILLYLALTFIIWPINFQLREIFAIPFITKVLAKNFTKERIRKQEQYIDLDRLWHSMTKNEKEEMLSIQAYAFMYASLLMIFLTYLIVVIIMGIFFGIFSHVNLFHPSLSIEVVYLIPFLLIAILIFAIESVSLYKKLFNDYVFRLANKYLPPHQYDC